MIMDNGQWTMDNGRKMKGVFLILGSWFLALGSLTLTSCDLHEFPAIPETRPVEVHVVTGQISLATWEHTASEIDATTGYEDLHDGVMRYVVRSFPILKDITGKEVTMLEHNQEFVFYRDLADKKDHEFAIQLPSGKYEVMVWADMAADSIDYLYDITDFSRITLAGTTYLGGTDYRDAFRGKRTISIPHDYIERPADTLRITLERPLAKYTLVSTDLKLFIEKEMRRIAGVNKDDKNTFSLSNYIVRYQYYGYTPNTYSLFTDQSVDATIGLWFETQATQLDEDKAMLGFDYVFTKPEDGVVNLRVAMLTANRDTLAHSDELKINLRRNHLTVIEGEFMTKKMSGGVVINPDFDGDINVTLP